MPTLTWLTRESDLQLAQKAPYRLLEHAPELSFGDPDTGNMLIQGDNLEGLKALLPYYAGRIKCVSIDPPYNTRSAFEQYDDNLFGESASVETSYKYAFDFSPDSFPAKEFYRGEYKFRKHYYPFIGELESSGEEFDCAQIIDSLPQVKYWVKNMPNQPEASFWLPTSTDRFYPDFVAELNDGRIFVVVYKGKPYVTNDDSKEKRNLGE
jgi:hypothetical protein